MFLGVFSLRDMYEQFQNIMKMGPFGQIMVSGHQGTESNLYSRNNIFKDAEFFLWKDNDAGQALKKSFSWVR